MAKNRSPAAISDDGEDTTANQQEGSQDTTSVTGGPQVNEGNPPTGAGRPAPGNVDQQQAWSKAEPDAAHAPTQAEKDAGRIPLSEEEALQLLKAGHRLRHKGDDPSNWVGMSRHGGELAVSFAATEAEIASLFDGSEFLLAD